MDDEAARAAFLRRDAGRQHRAPVRPLPELEPLTYEQASEWFLSNAIGFCYRRALGYFDLEHLDAGEEAEGFVDRWLKENTGEGLLLRRVDASLWTKQGTERVRLKRWTFNEMPPGVAEQLQEELRARENHWARMDIVRLLRFLYERPELREEVFGWRRPSE